MPDITADAQIAARHFKADAWILGERQRHHRIRDHFGVESDLYVALSAHVGPYAAYTPIHYVLADLVTRIQNLENGDRVRASVTADAWLAASGTYGLGIFTADAALARSQSGSFTGDSWLIRGGSFTADAIFHATFTANAFLV